MAVERQPPDVLAMILADAVLKDCGTGKCFIQGTYSVLTAAEFPFRHGLMIYAAITGGHGKTELELRLDKDGHDTIPLAKVMVDFPDPIVVLEAAIGLQGVPFVEPGEYFIQLYGAGQLLRSRRLQVGPPYEPNAASHEQEG